eukprot:COSAG02_NODE_1898_length_10461_cov_3.844528_1_plen_60_part_00
MGKAIVEAAGRGEHFERRRGAQHETISPDCDAQCSDCVSLSRVQSDMSCAQPRVLPYRC